MLPSHDLLPLTIPFDVFGYTLSDNSWRVFGLASGSTLATAGLKPNDQITQFNGAAYDPASLQSFRDKLADSDAVKLTVQRDGKAARHQRRNPVPDSPGVIFGLTTE